MRQKTQEIAELRARLEALKQSQVLLRRGWLFFEQT